MAGTVTAAFVFVDLVGSTDLLSRLGDDANDEVRRRYIAALRDAVARTAGVEVKTMGDGMMVAFERSIADAVSCGVEMQRAVHRLRRADPLLQLQIRVGISLGEAAPQERDWHGTPVVEAARLEHLARPGQILANDVVRQLLGTRGGFDCTAVGNYELKGFPEPLACCEIAWEPDPGLAEVPLPVGLSRGALALTGRDDELRALARHWDAVTAGAAAAVVVSGEPGIGKTQLAAELAARAQASGATVLFGQCDADAAIPDQPIAEALRWYAAACTPALLREQLATDGDVLLGLVPSLSARVPELAGTPRRAAGRTELGVAVRAFLARVASAAPLLLIVDDFHNSPPLTQELVGALAAAPPDRCLLVVLSRRGDDLAAVAGVDRVRLTGLARGDVAALVNARMAQLADPPAVDADALAATIIDETGGNPRHVLELLEHAVATGGLHADAAGQLAAVRAAAAGTCPYKGLLAFQPEDADVFFGRDDDIAGLVSRLAGQRLVAVVGASGSGKSSVVRAGVLPALRRGALAGSEHWPVVVFTPGPHPAAELAAACAGVVGTSTGKLLAELTQNPGGLAAAVSASNLGRLVVFVDQFEETFTLCDDPAERSTFVDALLAAAAAPGGPVLVLGAMRADFFGFGASIPGLAAALESSTTLLGPMDEDGLRAAIEGPARVAGLKIEPGLVDLMLRDVAGEPGSLPLLSHALLETWKRREDRTLLVAGYRECGGVRGAIARTAEAVYLGLDAGQQALARSVFVRLTELGEGTEDTRRRVPLQELRPDPTASDDLDQVLRTLTDARLLTMDDHTVEVAHEALIREWPRLRAWLDEDREGIRTLRHLTESAHAWDELGRDPAELYRGPRLAAALDWSAHTPTGLNPLEQQFLDASRDRTDRERIEAERRTRRFRLLFAGTVVALILALIGGGIAVRKTGEARDQTRKADIQRLVGQSAALLDTKRDLGMLLAVEANRRSNRVDTQGALLSALVHEPTFLGYVRPGTADVLSVALTNDGTRMLLGDANGRITVADVATHERIGEPITAFDNTPIFILEATPDDVVVAMNDPGTLVSGFDLATHKRLYDIKPDQTVATLAVSPDGTRFATGGYIDPAEQPKITIWDSHSGKRITTLPTDPSRPTAADDSGPNRAGIAFSSTGLLAVGDANTITLYDAKSLGRVGQLSGVPEAVGLALNFTPDGRQLVSGNARDGKMMMWDVASQKPVWPKPASDELFALTTTREHDVLYSNRFGNVIRLSGATGEPTGAPLSLQTGSVCDLKVSRDGGTLAVAACNEASGALFSLDGRNIIGPIAAQDQHVGGYTSDSKLLWTENDGGIFIRDAQTFAVKWRTPSFPSAGFSPDDRYLAVVGPDGKGGLYDYRAGRFIAPPVPVPRPLDVSAAGYDKKSLNLALGYLDGTVLVLARDASVVGPQGIRLGSPGQETTVHGLSFSPDGKRLAVAGQDERTIVFDTATGKPVGDPIPRAANAAISPDNRFLATAAFDGTLAFYDAVTLEPTGKTVTGSRAWAQSLEFSDDSRILATTALDSSARLFDVATRQQIGAPFPVAPDTAAALRPDGLAFALEVGTDDAPRTQVWDLDPAHWLTTACLEAGRNLTHAEWDTYMGGSYRATCPQWPAGS